MIKAKDGDFFVSDWLRNRNTLEYIGAWESLNNPDFNYGEFAVIKDGSGLNSFKISVKEWVERTGSIGIMAKTGRYGGTYAHKDIAFNFGMWISPMFQLYIVKEYQRLKDIEQNKYGLEWDVKRILSKTNYQIHTDAVKNYIVPKAGYTAAKEWLLYADEADLLNIVIFGCTAVQWRLANPQRALKGENIRDMASINELALLSNIESLNAILIKQGITKTDRLRILGETVREQKPRLDAMDIIKSLKREDEETYLQRLESAPPNQLNTAMSSIKGNTKKNESDEPLTDFDKNIKTALNYNPRAKE